MEPLTVVPPFSLAPYRRCSIILKSMAGFGVSVGGAGVGVAVGGRRVAVGAAGFGVSVGAGVLVAVGVAVAGAGVLVDVGVPVAVGDGVAGVGVKVGTSVGGAGGTVGGDATSIGEAGAHAASTRITAAISAAKLNRIDIGASTRKTRIVPAGCRRHKRRCILWSKSVGGQDGNRLCRGAQP